jgi:AcrR family transcriptional regulator
MLDARNSTERNGKKGQFRDAALAAASRLFVERGFGGTNMKGIADALGISRPALYYYFESKEAILSALVEQIMVAAKKLSEAVTERSKTAPQEALSLQIAQHAKLVLTHTVEFRVLERDEARLPIGAQKIAAKAKRALLDNFTATIQHGIELRQFRPVDPRIAAFGLIGMCNWTAWWYKPEGRKSIDEIADELADFGLNSLLRRPGGPKVRRAIEILDKEWSQLRKALEG